MDSDCRRRRGEFIDSSVKIREMFSFAYPCEVITAIEKHCCSFYGSNLYDMRSPAVQSLCAAWRTAIKLSWNVDRASHSYFIPAILAPGLRPLQASLLSRFHNFFLSTLESPSLEVQVMSRLSGRDLRSNFGSNLRLIVEKTGLDPWEVNNKSIKEKLSAAETSHIPTEDKWRVPLLRKYLDKRLEAYYSGNTEEEDKLTYLIRCLMISQA